MLHLVYTLRPTAHARRDLPAFWRWVSMRERWFYTGLQMARDPRWMVCTIGAQVHTIEHSITFSNEAAWGDYRKAVSQRSRDKEWETRRVEQDIWWEILDARLLNDAPLPAREAPPHD